MSQHDLIPHLFRIEFRKITAVLCKHFGLAHVEVAEDIASETFLLAMETWKYQGIPPNPTGWLYTTAKNKVKNLLHRDQIFKTNVAQNLSHDITLEPAEPDLSEPNITDSQLQMLFAICHPAIAPEAQIGLALRLLCGFGIEEIATAFLTNTETISKRLYRAKEKLREERISLQATEAAIHDRLEAVLTTIYLLFNEGYYSESSDTVLREDLCHEAMRLTTLLLYNPQTSLPKVHALFALMCFHSSRFKARTSATGELILYADQDETLWDKTLITKGAFHLHQASQGELTRYHLEAGIAYWHTVKEDTHEKWEAILQLYNRLLQIEYSPIAALNRTFALAKANGKAAALAEAEKLQLTTNPFYYTLLGELYTGIDNAKAKDCFRQALALAKSSGDKNAIQKRMDGL